MVAPGEALAVRKEPRFVERNFLPALIFLAVQKIETTAVNVQSAVADAFQLWRSGFKEAQEHVLI